MTSPTIFRAADFLATLGVNTHIPYTDGGYADLGTVKSDLAYLGIQNVRDGISNGEFGSASLSSYVDLAKSGVKFTIAFGGGSISTADVDAKLALIGRLNTAVPGSVVAVEGSNEINNWAVTFNGVSGLAGAVAMQKYIYAKVHATPSLAGVSVDYFTGYDAGSIAAGPDPSTTAGLADFDTQHPYPQSGQAPAAWVDPRKALGNEKGQQGPFVYTETGYSTYGTGSDVVSQTVQAKYMLDLVLDTAQAGASKTYLYQLMDAYAPGSRQGDDGFGLFNPDKTPKLAATAIHNLTTILADKGAAAATFQPGATPAVTVKGLPATGHQMMIAKSDGTVDLAIWNEATIWNPTTKTEVAAPAVKASIALGAFYDHVSVYDPLNGTMPVQVFNHVNALDLSVTDHPLVVELSNPSHSVSITTPGGSTNETRHTISGRIDFAAANNRVELFDGKTSLGTTTVGADGSWSKSLTFENDGVHAVTAQAVDTAGRATTSGPISFTLDSSPNAGLFGSVTHDFYSAGGQVAALYDAILGHAPDVLSMEAWAGAVKSGTKLTDVARALLGSTEHTQAFGDYKTPSDTAFLTQLYKTALHRAPDGGGLNAWKAQLAKGMSRESVAAAMTASDEHKNGMQAAFKTGIAVPDQNAGDIARLYHGLLGRDPDRGGLQGWQQSMAHGQSIGSVAQQFLDSTEYKANHAGQTDAQFVTGLYQSALGHAPDASGLQNGLATLNHGVSRSTFALGIAESQEARSHWVGAIENGHHIV